jgi:hypothetical protein
LEQQAGWIISTEDMIGRREEVNDVGTISAMPAMPSALAKAMENEVVSSLLVDAPSLPTLEGAIREEEHSLPMYTTKKHAHVRTRTPSSVSKFGLTLANQHAYSLE